MFSVQMQEFLWIPLFANDTATVSSNGIKKLLLNGCDIFLLSLKGLSLKVQEVY